MECHNIEEKVSAYREGLLSSEEKIQVEGHLKACKKCTLSLKELKKTIAYTQGLEEIEPPPWITQKVMARLREGPVQKGILRKLFYPLHIKVPIEVIATLAIVVTAFYVFKAVQPEMKPAKTPSEEVIVSEAEQDKISAFKDESFSYEAPAKAPAPAKKQRIEKADSISGKTERVEPPVALREEMAAPQESYRALDMKVKKESRKIGPEAEYGLIQDVKEDVVLTLYVEDTEKGVRKIEEIIKGLGGKIIKTESFKKKNILFAKLDFQKIEELDEKLKLIGKVREKSVLSSRGVDNGRLQGDAVIKIEIVEKSLQLP